MAFFKKFNGLDDSRAIEFLSLGFRRLIPGVELLGAPLKYRVDRIRGLSIELCGGNGVHRVNIHRGTAAHNGCLDLNELRGAVEKVRL